MDDPKEKAKELFEKYFFEVSGIVYNPIAVANYRHIFNASLGVAKKCAVIAVDEILEYTKEAAFPMGNVDVKFDYDPYWEEVKEELINYKP